MIFNKIVDSELFEAIKTGEFEKAAGILSGIIGRGISVTDINDYIKE